MSLTLNEKVGKMISTLDFVEVAAMTGAIKETDDNDGLAWIIHDVKAELEKLQDFFGSAGESTIDELTIQRRGEV